MSNLYNELAWNKIDWALVQQRVSRIQRRIYKARKEEKKGIVQFLQRKLIHSLDAKLISVRQVTTLNKGKNTKGVDDKLYTTPQEKWKLANSLTLNGKADIIRRTYIPKPGKTEMRPLGIPTIRDRAKQNLVKLALEPEWEAIFESGSYGFRPGRSCQDAIENIFTSTRSKPKYILDADISKCFDQINHDELLRKLDTIPLIENQIKAWLKAEIMTSFAKRQKSEIITPDRGTPQGGVISPLLANIALHGLGTYLKEWYVNSVYSNKRQGKVQRAKELGFVRYADDFVIITPYENSIEVIQNLTENWLNQIGLTLSKEKTRIRKTTEGFEFLGFHIVLSKRNGKYRCRIHISRQSKKNLLIKTRSIIQQNKSASAYELIKKLAPIIIGWGNYFQYSECSKEFQNIDHRLFGQLRAWVFRRKAPSLNRTKLKEKYFPSGKTYVYHGTNHQDNWVLCGKKKTKNGKISEAYLPKLSWISSKKFVKVKGDASIYDGNHIYWSARLSKYSFYSTRAKKLISQQKGKCILCGSKFISTDIIEVDHIKPLSQGGTDLLRNCQAIHKTCHILKSRNERVLGKL